MKNFEYYKNLIEQNICIFCEINKFDLELKEVKTPDIDGYDDVGLPIISYKIEMWKKANCNNCFNSFDPIYHKISKQLNCIKHHNKEETYGFYMYEDYTLLYKFWEYDKKGGRENFAKIKMETSNFNVNELIPKAETYFTFI
jgi:ribosome-associated translation inhibitor RaiA